MAKTIQIAENGMIVNVVMVDDAATISKNGKRIDWDGDGLDAPPGATFMAVEDTQIGWLLKNGAFTAPPEPDAPPSRPLVRLPKAELWRRATNEEAEAIDNAFAAAAVRLRRIFEATQHLDTREADYPALRAVIVTALGKKRAGEILALSE